MGSCACVLEHEHEGIVGEHNMVLYEVHEGTVGGHNIGKETAQKVLSTGLWWPSVFKEAKEYCKHCDVF